MKEVSNASEYGPTVLCFRNLQIGFKHVTSLDWKSILGHLPPAVSSCHQKNHKFLDFCLMPAYINNFELWLVKSPVLKQSRFSTYECTVVTKLLVFNILTKNATEKSTLRSYMMLACHLLFPFLHSNDYGCLFYRI